MLLGITGEFTMKMIKTLTVAGAFAGAMLTGTASFAQEKFITIGTGGQTGVYSWWGSRFAVW